MANGKIIGLAVVIAAAVALSACGRKGPLEPPPGKSAAGLFAAVADILK